MGDNGTSEKRSWANDEGETSQENPAAASSSTRLPEKLEECIRDFNSFKDPSKIDDLIRMIKELLQTSQQPDNASTSSQVTGKIDEKRSMLTCFTKSGSKFLKSVNERLEKTGIKEYSKEGTKVATEILQLVGQTNWLIGGLSMIAYLISTTDKMSENRTECLELLRCMIDLAEHLKSLKHMHPQHEKTYACAIEVIVEGSVTCASQLKSNKSFRFLKASVNSEALGSIRRKISGIQQELMLITGIETLSQGPGYHDIPKRYHPGKAVAFEKPVDEVMNIFRATDQSSRAVVLYGFGGIGKTTLAEAVYSKVDPSIYNFSRVQIFQDPTENELKSLQRQILRDCFPGYNGGKEVMVRDCKDGRGQLMEAFKCEKNKPICLFIDNALRSADLKELLPEDLGGLPQGSRILVTTRNLQATEMFEGQPNLVRRPYSLQTLPDEDAMKILFKDPNKRGTIKNEDLERVLNLCYGVPLVLKIVGAQLQKQDYQVHNCDNLLAALEKEGPIKDEKPSECLVDFVYGELHESTQEAFLDICCFFSNWNRQDVEYIVGKEEVASLLEAGLITSGNYPNAVFPHSEELIVHDIIKARGRSLANGSRIMDVQSLSEAADEGRLNQIKGVWLVEDKSEYVIEGKHLNLMSKSLRVLSLGERMKVSRPTQMKFEELRFLGVGGDNTELLVKSEALDKLRVFHGPFFVGGEFSLHKLPKSLLAMKVKKQTDGTDCTNSQMTGALPCCLEKLDFSELSKLPQLPEGFNQLSLKFLNLDGLSEMRELPKQICQLPALETLTMRNCLVVEGLPPSFGHLSTLIYLDLYGCQMIDKLPNTFGQLTALRVLDIRKTALKTPPSNFRQLTSLQHVECSSASKGIVQKQISSKVKINICPQISGKAVGGLPKKLVGLSPTRAMASSPPRVSIVPSLGK